MGDQFPDVSIGRPTGAEFADDELKKPHESDPAGSNFEQSFSPHLSWSHYRALMRVAKVDARDFYERETIECGWDKRSLERQIHSQYYERMLVSQNPQQMIESARREIAPRTEGIETLKNPYVLEFLGLPEVKDAVSRFLEEQVAFSAKILPINHHSL
jgi:hypothetical protein